MPVGLAENIPNIVPVLETPEDIAAAREALRETTGMFLTPILEGSYHPAYLADQGADAPVFTDAEMKTIATPLDFVGLNCYAPVYVRHDPASPRGWSAAPFEESYPRMLCRGCSSGRPSSTGPRGWSARSGRCPPSTSRRTAAPRRTCPTSSGQVLDTGRVMYLQQHLIHAHRAVAEGYPLKGYFLWSLVDNFEWAWGYTRRFGICHVDYETLARTPKLGARFYADVIRRNAVGGS